MAFKPVALTYAAQLLSLKSDALVKRMRDAGMFSSGKIPRPDLIKAGYFIVEQRSWQLDNGINKPYQITLVTLQGLAFLERALFTRKEAA